MIRPAREDKLREPDVIERETDALLAKIGMSGMATAAPGSFLLARRAGRLLIAVTHADESADFVRLEIVDSIPHTEQVNVPPGYTGRGLGVCLLDTAEE